MICGDFGGRQYTGQRRQEKPSKKKSTERIDGIVAAIMALGRAMLQPEEQCSVYETRGLIVL